jgi:hypothetical protein
MLRYSWVVVLGCGHASAPPKPVATHASALAAYEAKNYPLCAEQFTATAKSVEKLLRPDELYSAACCHALAGKPELAFASLVEAAASGFKDLDGVSKDPDLIMLHADPRWLPTLDRMRAQIAAREAAIKDPALRRELADLVKQDQAARMAYTAAVKAGGKGDFSAADAADAATLVVLHRVVAASGWPGKPMVGDEGAHDAWLLVQHMDKDPAFQKQVLGLMKELVKTDEVEEVEYAYLYDRVAVAEHRKQLYGTQFDAHQQPQPIEDEAHVDARRNAVGLGTMDEYRAQMRKIYGAAK